MTHSSKEAAALSVAIEDRSAVIGVVGLGYVGMPLAVGYGERGYRVIGFDSSPRKREMLSQGINPIQDVDDDSVKDLVDRGIFTVASDDSEYRDANVIFVCVPTPVTDYKTPDNGMIVSAVEKMLPHLREGQLIILKSTVYPGATEELICAEITRNRTDLRIGDNVFVAFSPERVDPGNQVYTTENTPIVVGGVSSVCTDLAADVVGRIVNEVHRVSSPKVAEMEKLLENIFRSVNIALVNELARLCDRIGGISIWEVVEAAATKPFGFMPFFPGPGLGGHCIPIDPYYLSWVARKYDFEPNFITLSARINEEMPFYVTEAVFAKLVTLGVSLDSASVLILGAAFKKNVDDTRHSPAVRIIELLTERGIKNIQVADPYVDSLDVRVRGEQVRLTCSRDASRLVREADVCVMVTDHETFDYEDIAANAKAVVDTRNAFRGLDPTNYSLLGDGTFFQN